jgi:hypothetical protein
LETKTWLRCEGSNATLPNISRAIDGLKPEPRYGHSQNTLDNDRIIIVGGCVGPNKQFDDAWILHWPSNPSLNAYWEKLTVRNEINSPLQFACVPFIRCVNKIISFGKARTLRRSQQNATTDEEQAMTIYGTNKRIQKRVCSCSNGTLGKDLKCWLD